MSLDDPKDGSSDDAILGVSQDTPSVAPPETIAGTSATSTSSEDDFAPMDSLMSIGHGAAPGEGSVSMVGGPGLSEAPPGTQAQASATSTEEDFAPIGSMVGVGHGSDHGGAQGGSTQDAQSRSVLAPPPMQFESALPDGGTVPGMAAVAPGPDPIPSIRQHSANAAASAANVQAAFPFSVLIEGHLAEHEKARLLDFLNRENIDISEVELEPQFAAGRILIPRISEFAAIQIIQSVRGARATIKAGPSDTIFSTEDTRDPPHADVTTAAQTKMATAHTHPADLMPMTSDSKLPGFPDFRVIDVITASASLRTNMVEAQASLEYQEALEALAREIKFRAFHRGAAGVINYSVQLVPLDLPSHYRMMVSGTAVRTSPA